MELKDRLLKILKEQNLKQKEFADAVKVTEGYISNILSGKRSRISDSLAALIEQQYGYSARWLLSGEGTCHAAHPAQFDFSPAKRKLIAQIEQLSDSEIEATRVFVESLDAYKRAFQTSAETDSGQYTAPESCADYIGSPPQDALR